MDKKEENREDVTLEKREKPEKGGSDTCLSERGRMRDMVLEKENQRDPWEGVVKGDSI